MEAHAKAFATHAHEKVGQRRKYTGEPYIVHPAEVVELVRSVPHTEAMILASWLHRHRRRHRRSRSARLRIISGQKVASLVEMVTDVSTLADGNRFARKEIDREHLQKASPRRQNHQACRYHFQQPDRLLNTIPSSQAVFWWKSVFCSRS